jgi:hypothetical protein
MTKKDPFADLRPMGVTMSVVTPSALPKTSKKRGKATPKKVVAAVREALHAHRGVSAATIAAVIVPELADLCEGITGGCWSYPSDPDDFSRCRRIVALVPNGVARLVEVAAAFPTSRAWQRLAPAWSELDALYAEEANARADRNMPKLYTRISELTR